MEPNRTTNEQMQENRQAEQPPQAQPYAPAETVVPPAPAPAAVPAAANSYDRSNKLKFIWGLICLIGPTALLILTILTYVVVNIMTTSNTTDAGSGPSLFGNGGIGTTIINILLYLVGMVVVLTWLPGIIVGIVLLATRRK